MTKPQCHGPTVTCIVTETTGMPGADATPWHAAAAPAPGSERPGPGGAVRPLNRLRLPGGRGTQAESRVRLGRDSPPARDVTVTVPVTVIRTENRHHSEP